MKIKPAFVLKNYRNTKRARFFVVLGQFWTTRKDSNALNYCGHLTIPNKKGNS